MERFIDFICTEIRFAAKSIDVVTMEMMPPVDPINDAAGD